ncbi:MAG: hypothetical protein K8S87_03390 [Planctomycetes bacterium]|nr:hypothetical protein [Planctomycetota bacterium]
MILENSTYNVVIRSIYVDADSADLSKQLKEELKLSENQCAFVINNVPVVLYSNIGEDEVDIVKPRLDILMQSGLNCEITKESVDNIAVIDWSNTEMHKEHNDLEIEMPEEPAKPDEPDETKQPEEIFIECPCTNCGSVMKILKTAEGLEISALTSATKNPLLKKTDELAHRKYSNEELAEIGKAVIENVFGGIERMQDLPTKPNININFEDYGFKSVKHFMEYQNSIFLGNSLESWTGGN